MGAPEVEAFLTHLAEVRQVSPSTHKQALAALLFLYREVLKMDLPWMAEVGRPRAVRRLPVVLTTDELQRTLAGRELTLDVTARARERLAAEGYDPVYGARPLKRNIQKLVQDPLALRLLEGAVPAGSTVTLDADPSGEGVAFTAEIAVVVPGA